MGLCPQVPRSPSVLAERPLWPQPGSAVWSSWLVFSSFVPCLWGPPLATFARPRAPLQALAGRSTRGKPGSPPGELGTGGEAQLTRSGSVRPRSRDSLSAQLGGGVGALVAAAVALGSSRPPPPGPEPPSLARLALLSHFRGRVCRPGARETCCGPACTGAPCAPHPLYFRLHTATCTYRGRTPGGPIATARLFPGSLPDSSSFLSRPWRQASPSVCTSHPPGSPPAGHSA